MKRSPRQHVISCALCHDWSIDVSPWISCRVLTWPRPVAMLLFRLHRHHAHRAEYPAWKAKFDRQAER